MSRSVLSNCVYLTSLPNKEIILTGSPPNLSLPKISVLFLYVDWKLNRFHHGFCYHIPYHLVVVSEKMLTNIIGHWNQHCCWQISREQRPFAGSLHVLPQSEYCLSIFDWQLVSGCWRIISLFTIVGQVEFMFSTWESLCFHLKEPRPSLLFTVYFWVRFCFPDSEIPTFKISK